MVIKLLLWSKLIMRSCFKYRETPTKMEDFHSLPVEQGWQDTIRFKEEVHSCSILKRLVSNCIHICQEVHSEFSVSCLRGVATPDPRNASICYYCMAEFQGSSKRTMLNIAMSKFCLIDCSVCWLLMWILSNLLWFCSESWQLNSYI